MSIVVVVKKSGTAVIAADTLYGFGSTNLSQKYISKESKILRFEDSLIGTVGAPAHDVVLRDLFETKRTQIALNSKQEIFETYLRMHKILKEDYFLNTDEEENKEYESSQIAGLIANQYGIFGMYTLREVFEFDRFWAIGSGTEFALGAMFAVYETLADAAAIAEIGIKAACEFNDACGLPLEVHTVELSDTAYQPKPRFKGKKRN